MRHVCIYFRLCSCSRSSSHSSRKATNHPPALATLRTGQKKNKKAGRQVRKDFLGKLGSPYTRHAPLLCFPCHEVFSCVTHLTPVSLRFYVVVAPPEKKKVKRSVKCFTREKNTAYLGRGSFVFPSLLHPVNAFSRILDVPVERISLVVSLFPPTQPPNHTHHTHHTHTSQNHSGGDGGSRARRTGEAVTVAKTKKKSTYITNIDDDSGAVDRAGRVSLQ
ncbi:hypothetical protein K456DRAFT_246782 [Colletotrichum gloeosporioides 23]|nr:hypothetical protein K456DRAFT_246782 [Colletotrichum gloeosporioides 23]